MTPRSQVRWRAVVSAISALALASCSGVIDGGGGTRTGSGGGGSSGSTSAAGTSSGSTSSAGTSAATSAASGSVTGSTSGSGPAGSGGSTSGSGSTGGGGASMTSGTGSAATTSVSTTGSGGVGGGAGTGSMTTGGVTTGTGGAGTGGAGGGGSCREPVTVKVPAWSITNSGVYVRTGESVTVSAKGQWQLEGAMLGPDGRGSGACPTGALAVRIGKFYARQCVKASSTLVASRDGYLWFFQNSGTTVDYSKQGGALDVTITGGNSCSGIRPEGVLSVFQDPAFDKAKLATFESTCGQVAVHFESDSPNDPVVQAYVANFMEGDPKAFMHKAVLAACAANYASPQDWPPSYASRRMRVVHYLGAQKWNTLGKPPYQDARGTYWDFDLSFTVAELSTFQHYGRFGSIPEVFLHEMGHVLSPDGAVSGVDVPRWIQETYADLSAVKAGPCAETMDYPEHWVLYGRQQPYCDGYVSGAPFFDAMDREYPGFIHKLSAHIASLGASRTKWPGSEAVWQTLTGKGIAAAYDEYLKKYEITLKKPVAMCSFPNDVP